MLIPIANRELLKPMLFFFLAVLVFKITYEGYTAFTTFQRWEENGLFEYNDKGYFMSTAVWGAIIGLIPYLVIGFVVVSNCKALWLAVATWVAIIAADIFSDFIYRNASDGQTGIHIAFVYLVLFGFVTMCFFFLNSYLKPDEKK